MENKILVELIVPELEEKFDVILLDGYERKFAN